FRERGQPRRRRERRGGLPREVRRRHGVGPSRYRRRRVARRVAEGGDRPAGAAPRRLLAQSRRGVTEIDFYILDRASDEFRLTFACRLADKAADRGLAVLIRPSSPVEAKTLDELLWTFSQGSFLPHRLASDAREPLLEPVVIDDGPGPVGDRWDLLINLASDVPEYFSRCARRAEIVDGDASRRAQGRERYRFYRDRGYSLKTHQIRA